MKSNSKGEAKVIRIKDGYEQVCNKCDSVWKSYLDYKCIWCGQSTSFTLRKEK